MLGCTGDGSGGGDGSGSFVADVTHDWTGEIFSRELLFGCTGDGSGGGDGGMSGEYHEGDEIIFGCTGDGSDGGDGGGFAVDGFKNISIGKRKAGGCAGSDDDGHEDEEDNADDDGAVDDDEVSEANDGDSDGEDNDGKRVWFRPNSEAAEEPRGSISAMRQSWRSRKRRELRALKKQQMTKEED